MDPQHEIGIFRRIRGAFGKSTSGGLQLAVYALMNLADPVEGFLTLSL